MFKSPRSKTTCFVRNYVYTMVQWKGFYNAHLGAMSPVVIDRVIGKFLPPPRWSFCYFIVTKT